MLSYSEPFRLSSAGSTRATAYGFGNKSVTLDGKTHVVWLDAVAQVCGRTYDHATGAWGGTLRLFEGCDNHTTPTLTVDRNAHLRIAFGPHGCWGGWNYGRFKWCISERPNSLGAWSEPYDFGYNATYACMVHTPQDLDVIVYRGGEAPASLMLQKRRALGGWTTAREIVRQDITPQYTHLAATVACDEAGTLYVACHLYNVGGEFGGPAETQRSYGVAVLKSGDLGETWSDLRGEPVTVPTLYEERIAIPPLGANVRMHGLALDSRGALWALCGGTTGERRDLLLSRWTGEGWEQTDLAHHVPADRVVVDAVLTIDTRDRIHTAMTAVRPEPADDASENGVWGHSSLEVFHLVADASLTQIECNQISPTDDAMANWLPNISRKGLHCPVENPVILFTHGHKGDGCSPPDETEAYCVFVRQGDGE